MGFDFEMLGLEVEVFMGKLDGGRTEMINKEGVDVVEGSSVRESEFVQLTIVMFRDLPWSLGFTAQSHVRRRTRGQFSSKCKLQLLFLSFP